MRHCLSWTFGIAFLAIVCARIITVDAQPVGMVLVAACSGATIYITEGILSSGSGTYTQPINCNHLRAEVIGVGGEGNYQAGGGGGGYSDSGIVPLASGTTISYHYNNPGILDTWVCNSTSNCTAITGTAVIAGAHGGGFAGNGGPAGLGASTTGAIGAIKYGGGAGANGGGGAGGPYGAGNSASGSNGGSGDAGHGGAGGTGNSGAAGANGTEMGGGIGAGGGGSYDTSQSGRSAGGSCGGGTGGSAISNGEISIGAACIKLTPLP